MEASKEKILEEFNIKQDKSGFYYTHSSHLHALKDGKANKELACYTHMELKDKVILDIGANAGQFNRLCYESEAKKYIGIEPDPENFRCLQLNNKIEDSILINTAVSCFDDEKIGFFRANSGNKLIGFVDRINGNTTGRNYIEVNNTNFLKLVEEHQPQVIKCDAEGIEFDLFSKGLPDCVEEVCMEVHIYNNEERLKTFWFDIMNKTFFSMGWKCVLTPIYDDREIKSYNGLNVFSIGWKRPSNWKQKRQINKFKSLKRCLIRNFGHVNYMADQDINKYAVNFLKGEFTFEDFNTFLENGEE